MTVQAPAAPAAGGDPARPWMPTPDQSDPAQVIAGMKADPQTAVILQNPLHPAHKATTERWNNAFAGKVTNVATGQSRIDAMRADPDTVKALTDANDPRHTHVKAEWERAHMGAAAAEVDTMEVPPEKPEGYSIDNVAIPNEAQRMEPELVAEAQKLAHVAGLSQGEWDGILTVWNRLPACEPLTPELEKAKGQACFDALCGRIGVDKASAAFHAANAFLGNLPAEHKAAIDEWVVDSGLIFDPYFVQHLALIGEKRAARAAKAGR